MVPSSRASAIKCTRGAERPSGPRFRRLYSDLLYWSECTTRCANSCTLASARSEMRTLCVQSGANDRRTEHKRHPHLLKCSTMSLDTPHIAFPQGCCGTPESVRYSQGHTGRHTRTRIIVLFGPERVEPRPVYGGKAPHETPLSSLRRAGPSTRAALRRGGGWAALCACSCWTAPND